MPKWTRVLRGQLWTTHGECARTNSIDFFSSVFAFRDGNEDGDDGNSDGVGDGGGDDGDCDDGLDSKQACCSHR